MNASQEEFRYSSSKYFAIAYAAVSLGALGYGWTGVSHFTWAANLKGTRYAQAEHFGQILQIAVLALLVLIVLLTAAYSVFLWKRSQNERIGIEAGLVTWINWRGKIQVQFPINDAVPGSFSVCRTQEHGRKYQVRSSQGELKWTGAIDKCDALINIFSAATGSQPYRF